MGCVVWGNPFSTATKVAVTVFLLRHKSDGRDRVGNCFPLLSHLCLNKNLVAIFRQGTRNRARPDKRHLRFVGLSIYIPLPDWMATRKIRTAWARKNSEGGLDWVGIYPSHERIVN